MTWSDGVEGDALKIASCDESPLRVVAGPGTGKTFALKKRVARLLEEGINPKRILVVTFTRTAARDMERELEDLNIPAVSGIVKSTLHSYCFQRLRDAQVFAQTGRVARPLLEFEERFLLEDLDNKDLLGDIHDRKREIKAFEAVWAREQDQQPGWSLTEDKDRKFQQLLGTWLRFHDAMLVAELIPTMLGYLRNNPGCPERHQFDQVLVDEYQDLNKAEQSLITSGASLI